MIIQITDPETKGTVGVDASSIFFVMRAADNPLVTLISTKVMTQKGPMQFAAMESPEEIIAMANGAMADVPLAVRPAGMVLAS